MVVERDSNAELARVSEAHRKKYGEVGDSWKEHVVVWKDSTPDNLMELIRADRGPEKAGSPIDSNDIFIGATALRYDLVLVSGNTKHMR